MKDTMVHMPMILNTYCNSLLYVDDMILLSYTQIGLRRLLRRFSSYCQDNSLIISKSKSKIMVFGRNHQRHRWQLDGEPIEQVNSFVYLGVTFSKTLGPIITNGVHLEQKPV
uniref:Reverse transcriptase domain-containing protein n=1 Tax=Micrurus paraensis TaxID=1970185 RepID=A0A2D4KF02_9SAUR